MAEPKSFPPQSLQTSSIECNNLPIYIAIEPRQLVFKNDPQTSSVLVRLTNVSPLRVAFRIRTNAPLKYVVLPASGFLTVNESVDTDLSSADRLQLSVLAISLNASRLPSCQWHESPVLSRQIALTSRNHVRITILNMKHYRRRHRFMIQAMEAKDSEKHRRNIWNDPRAEDLDLVQCIRVLTFKMRSPESKISESPSSQSPNSPSPGSNDTRKSSPHSQASNEELIVKIDQLTERINDEMRKKKKESENLLQIINIVKKVEIDLDRASAVCKDLDNRIVSGENEHKTLKEKITKIDAMLEKLRNNDMK